MFGLSLNSWSHPSQGKSQKCHDFKHRHCCWQWSDFFQNRIRHRSYLQFFGVSVSITGPNASGLKTLPHSQLTRTAHNVKSMLELRFDDGGIGSSYFSSVRAEFQGRKNSNESTMTANRTWSTLDQSYNTTSERNFFLSSIHPTRLLGSLENPRDCGLVRVPADCIMYPLGIRSTTSWSTNHVCAIRTLTVRTLSW